MKNGISNVLASKQKEASTTRKPVTRKQRLKNQKAKLNGKWKAKWSLAAPNTVVRAASYDTEGNGENLPFKISTNIRVSPRPKKTTKLYLETTYDLTDHTGKDSSGPSCFMGVDYHTGAASPLTRVRKARKQGFKSILRNGVLSTSLFPLEFSPAGNPWHPSGKWKLKSFRVRVLTKLPGNLRNDCKECPIGALCEPTKRRSLQVVDGTYIRRILAPAHSWKIQVQGISKHTAVYAAFPPANYYVAGTYKKHNNYRDLYFRWDTHGVCFTANHDPPKGGWTPETLFTKVCTKLNKDTFRERLDKKFAKCESRTVKLPTGSTCNVGGGSDNKNCKILQCGGGEIWSRKGDDSKNINQVDAYQVEHMWDDKSPGKRPYDIAHSGGHGYAEKVVNTRANFIMAWGKWNQGVSNIGKREYFFPDTYNEKKEIYGKTEMDLVDDLLKQCEANQDKNGKVEGITTLGQAARDSLQNICEHWNCAANCGYTGMSTDMEID